MPNQYISIAIFALLAAAFPVASFAALQRVRRNLQSPDALPDAPERQIALETSAPSSDSLRLPIVAMLFVIFGSAMVFLFPWAIEFSQMGSYGLVIAMVFVGILLAGYAWLYQAGALDGI